MLSRQALLSATRAATPARTAVPRVVFTSSQLRSYATPAQADSKPPVALYGLDGTYASALVRFHSLYE
jgi:F-type H+-transporting ATPase subunit O